MISVLTLIVGLLMLCFAVSSGWARQSNKVNTTLKKNLNQEKDIGFGLIVFCMLMTAILFFINSVVGYVH